MFLVSGVDMVCEACLAGVIGVFPLTNARTIDDCRQALDTFTQRIGLRRVQHPQERIAPFAINMVVHSSYGRFEEEMALVEHYRPDIVITALGSPARVCERVHAYGGCVWADVSSLAFAQKAIHAHVDGLVLLSAGAGGHTGSLSPFAFVRAIRNQGFHKIILLSGGIADAHSIRAAQVLGADLAYMGTHFIATDESLASPAYKAALVDACADDIVTSKEITGVNANFLACSLANARSPKDTAQSASLRFGERYSNTSSKPWKDIWSAGHGVGATQAITPLRDKIKDLEKAYNQLRMAEAK